MMQHFFKIGNALCKRVLKMVQFSRLFRKVLKLSTLYVYLIVGSSNFGWECCSLTNKDTMFCKATVLSFKSYENEF